MKSRRIASERTTPAPCGNLKGPSEAAPKVTWPFKGAIARGEGWKGAQTEAGTKAAASHTANLTGNYDLYRAAFRQSGLIEVHDVEEIVDIAKVFAQGRLPKGRAIGVLSISGGSGIVFADRAIKEGLSLPSFSPQTVAALKAIIPSFGSSENPADTTAGVFNDPSLFTKTLEIVLADPAIDQVSILLASISGDAATKACQAIADAAASTDKPSTSCGPAAGASRKPPGSCWRRPTSRFITTPVRMARAAAVLANFAMDRQRLLPRTAPPPLKPGRAEPAPRRRRRCRRSKARPSSAAFGIPMTREVLVPPGADSA